MMLTRVSSIPTIIESSSERAFITASPLDMVDSIETASTWSPRVMQSLHHRFFLQATPPAAQCLWRRKIYLPRRERLPQSREGAAAFLPLTRTRDSPAQRRELHRAARVRDWSRTSTRARLIMSANPE